MHWKRLRCQESAGRFDAVNVATLPNKHLMPKNTYWGNMPNPFSCHAHFVDECAIIYQTSEVTLVDVKRSNFLPERMIFLFRLLLTTRKIKEATMIQARKEMPDFQGRIRKYVVKMDKVFKPQCVFYKRMNLKTPHHP